MCSEAWLGLVGNRSVARIRTFLTERLGREGLKYARAALTRAGFHQVEGLRYVMNSC